MRMKWLATLSVALGVVWWTPPARAAGPSHDLGDYVLLGLQRVKLKDLSSVGSGDVGTNEPALRNFAAFGLLFGRGVVLADGTTAAGDVCIAGAATVYNLYTNRLISPLASVNIRGTGPAAVALPLISPLPPLPAFAPGATAVVVGGGRTVTLPPGAYADVLVQNGATLELTGGAYEFRNVTLGKQARLLVDAPSTLDIAGILRVSNQSFFGPADASLGPKDVVVNVGGVLVRWGADAQAVAYVYAPKATMLCGRDFQGTGQFVAKNINTDHSTHFTHPVCGNGVVETGEQCDPPSPGVCDATCHLVGSTTTTTETTTTTTDTTTTLQSSTTTSSPPTTDTTTTTTMPVAICGNGIVEPGEQCDPPGSACPPNGTCQPDCTCLFGHS